MCFSTLLLELEWDWRIDACIEQWLEQGITLAFIHSHRDGVTWDCTICDHPLGNRSDTADAAALALEAARAAIEHQQLCQTCVGHPPGHPECLGKRWIQVSSPQRLEACSWVFLGLAS